MKSYKYMNMYTHEIYRCREYNGGWLVLGNTGYKADEYVELIDGMLPDDYKFDHDYDIDWDIHFDEDFNLLKTIKFSADKVADIEEDYYDNHARVYVMKAIERHVKSQRLPLILGEYPEMTLREKLDEEMKETIAKIRKLSTTDALKFMIDSSSLYKEEE